MGSHGDVDVTTPFMEAEAEAKKQEHSLIAPPDLIEKMENVVVHSDLKQKAVVNAYGHKQNTGLECSESLPLRPYAGDCPHYVRTGTCKFGLSCRYNHPLKRTRQFVKGREYDTENPGMIECKYSIAGVCKNEKSCRYRHPGEVSGNAFPELNFMGLPMRPGEKECPYYMRKGSCGYGSLCIYHHPDPTSMVGEEFPKSLEDPFFPDNYYSDSQHLTGASQPDQASWSLHQFPNSGGSFSENLHLTGASQPDQASWSLHKFPNSGGSFSENLHLTGASQPDQASWSLHEFPNSSGAFSENLHLTGASQPDQASWSLPEFPNSSGAFSENLHLTGASQPDQASWSLNKFPNSGSSLSENFSPYEPVHAFSPWTVKQPEWNGYQNTSYFHQSMTAASGSDSKPDITVQVEEFPERPGQPECCYFITTGNCKSKFTCRYHHPKNRMPKPVEYVLNENGLPLRPGKNICRDYERIGLCKFGRACQYDHPASRGLVSRKLVSRGLVSRKLVSRGSAANADLPASSATVVGSGDGGLG